MPNLFQKVLVTGGAGFIGSNLVDRLLEEGADKIIIIDNFVTGQRQNVTHLLNDHRVEIIEQDLTDSTWLANWLASQNLEPLTFIFHFASPASPPRYQARPVLTYLVNSLVTHHLAQYTSQYSTRLFFASTSEVYGDPLVNPQPESYWGNVNPNGLRSCYDESKRLGETICGVWHRQTGADVRQARIFNTYGPRMDIDDGRVIPSFFQSILNNEALTVFGTGEQTRSFCYIDDLIEGIIRFAKNDDLSGQTINLGNPQEFNLLELVKIFEELSGQNLEKQFSELPADDPTRRRPDITKARRLLNWEPQVDLLTGLQKTYEYFKQQSGK